MLKYIVLSTFSLLLTTIMLSQDARDLMTEESVHHSIEPSYLSISTILAYSNQLNQKKSKEATRSLDSFIFYGKNDSIGEWDRKLVKQHLSSKYKYKTEYNYKDNNELIEVTESKWLYDAVQWQEMTKTEKHYNSSGVLQVDTICSKYTDSDEWEVFNKTEYEYNSGFINKGEGINISMLRKGVYFYSIKYGQNRSLL